MSLRTCMTFSFLELKRRCMFVFFLSIVVSGAIGNQWGSNVVLDPIDPLKTFLFFDWCQISLYSTHRKSMYSQQSSWHHLIFICPSARLKSYSWFLSMQPSPMDQCLVWRQYYQSDSDCFSKALPGEQLSGQRISSMWPTPSPAPFFPLSVLNILSSKAYPCLEGLDRCGRCFTLPPQS